MALRPVFPLVLTLTMSACQGSPSNPVTTSPTYTSHVPPQRPTIVAKGSRRWFVIDTMQLGLTSRATGAVRPEAWKDYGFDLDGRNTTYEDSKTSNGSCLRKSGSPTTVLADGHDGIDNNFGQYILAIVKSVKADADDALNARLSSGQMSWLLRIDGVPDDLGDNAAAPGALYRAGDLGKKATFTGADDWPVVGDWLEDGRTIDRPKVTFPGGYLTGGVWVSGAPSPTTFGLEIVRVIDAALLIPVDAGILAVRISDGSDGMLAGAMSLPKLAAAVDPVAAAFGVCPGDPPPPDRSTSYYDDLQESVAITPDLVLGAPQFQDTTKTCDAVSLGIGFTMKPARAPTRVVDPPPPPPNPCAPRTDAGP